MIYNLKHIYTSRNHYYKSFIFFLIILKILVRATLEKPDDFCFHRNSSPYRLYQGETSGTAEYRML